MAQELDIAAITAGQSHLIEANAGTGKTYAIANLFLRFVLDGHDVDEILVVTFTRAATDELRGRIRARLAEALRRLSGKAPKATGDPWFDALPERFSRQEERKQACLRLELALLSINQAPIHTIHGFCQQALSELAFHSGQSFDLEQADDRRLRRRLLHDWWRTRCYELDEPSLLEFLEATGGLSAFEQRLRPLLAPRPPRLHPPPLSADALAALRERAARLQRQLAMLWETHRETASDLLLNSKKLSRTKTNQQKKPILEALLAEITRSLREQPQKPLPPELLRRIATSGIDIKPSYRPCDEFEDEPFRTADALLRLTRELHRQQRLRLLEEARQFVQLRLERLKHEQGLLAFDDMIARLHNALEDAARGKGLARELARRLPVIMVDEFQDTDPLQYDIFRAIHAAGEPRHTLLMIGDPKQAIYGFRGGDIFAYLRAAEEADRHWVLSTNWRSTPALVEAVNRIFSGLMPFAFPRITHQASRTPPAARCRASGLEGPQAPPAALLLHRIPPTENGKPPNNAQAHQQVHELVARRIHWLLRESDITYRGRALREGDVCVLVRTGEEAETLRRTMRQQGIRAISAGNARLWDSEEATGLRWLLEAALVPDDRRLARQALAAPFLRLAPDFLHGLLDDPRRWGHWVALLQEVHESWRKRGFMAAFQALLRGLDTVLDAAPGTDSGWLARTTDPERCLTNLLHLAELLQQASREQGDAETLLAWMREQGEQAGEEEQLLRLESDEALVKIATVHASKGLQYPVVLVPYLWHCKPPTDKGPLCWHEPEDPHATRHYRPWPETDPRPLHLADRERLSEDLRLLYVALTRAESHCELVVGNVGKSSGRTAIDWLLSDRQQDFEQGTFKQPHDETALSAWEAPGIVQLQAMPASPASLPSKQPAPAPRPELVLAKPGLTIRNDWRIASFSAMTREVHRAPRIPPGEGADFALAYPSGTHVGLFLHALLERLDPTRPLAPQLDALVAPLALRHGLPAEQDLQGLAQWLEWILDTPLDAQGLRLRDLPTERTLHELPFDFATQRVAADALERLLRAHLPPEINPEQVPPLDFDTFQGMVTGVIDLVFEHRGRYYIADYKSNLLGHRLEDYQPRRLAQEIGARRYDLQYLLYSLALHRHLATRLPGYDYSRHFGGVYYLFLRGMRPPGEGVHGVWFHRPPADLIDALERDLFRWRTEEIPS